MHAEFAACYSESCASVVFALRFMFLLIGSGVFVSVSFEAVYSFPVSAFCELCDIVHVL